MDMIVLEKFSLDPPFFRHYSYILVMSIAIPLGTAGDFPGLNCVFTLPSVNWILASYIVLLVGEARKL